MNKMNKMKKKLLFNNSSSKNNTINTGNYVTPINIVYNNNDINTSININNSSRKKERKKSQNMKPINNNTKRNSENRDNNKKNMNKSHLNNSHLAPNNYVKSLYYAFNNHIHIVSTQFDNYNKTIAKNNKISNFKINKKISTNKNTPRLNCNNERSINNNNAKKVNGAGDKDDANQNLNNLKNEINKNIIIIQKCYRGYSVRNKIYNLFLFYSKLTKILYKNKKDFNINAEYSLHNKNNIITNSKKINNNYNICNIDNISINQYRYNNKDIIKKNNKNINYNICDTINFTINQINKKTNYPTEEIKLLEDKIKELNEEIKAIQQKNNEYQKNEEKYNNIKIENEKLKNIKNDILNEKSQILNELNNVKKDYEQILKEKKNISDFEIIKQIEININKEKEINNKGLNNEENNINKNDVNIEQNILKPKINDKKEREKYLKSLLKNKVYEMKDYIHKCFIKFYYNGIFLQMTGKLTHLNDEKDKNEIKGLNELSFSSENEVENNNVTDNQNNELNNIKEIEQKKKEEKEEKEQNELKERLKKSRGLRKLLVKKANDRLEKLRVNFYKFYQAGILTQFRKKTKKKTCVVKGSLNLPISKAFLQDENIEKKEKISKLQTSKNVTSKMMKEKEELKKRTIRVLERIIFKADRRNMIIKKKMFEKFCLKVKLESINNIINNDKGKKKKKKKKKIQLVGIIKKITKTIENSKKEEKEITKTIENNKKEEKEIKPINNE